MKRHRALGVLSLISSLPILAVSVFFLVTGAVFAMPILVIARVVIGGALLVAGIMLWRGHKSMHAAGLIAWGSAAIYAAVEAIVVSGAGQNLFYLLVGIPAFAFLLRESRMSHAA